MMRAKEKHSGKNRSRPEQIDALFPLPIVTFFFVRGFFAAVCVAPNTDDGQLNGQIRDHDGRQI